MTDEDEYCKSLFCREYPNCFQCPMGRDSFDENGNIINICKYEIDDDVEEGAK